MRLDLSRRANGELMREFTALEAKDHRSTAEMLIYVGEIQARRLYAPLGYSSMYQYCVHERHWSEDMAWKRTRVARLARRFPVVVDMVADGRLHLSGLVVLARYKNARQFPELLEATAHKTRAEIELLLAMRFPRPDAPTVVRPLATSAPCQGMAPGPVDVALGSQSPHDPTPHGPVDLGQPATPSEHASRMPAEAANLQSDPGAPPGPSARVQPLAPKRFLIQVTVGQATHDKLRRAQDLLGHQVPPGDLEQVLDRALEALIRQLEHARFSATDKPRHARERSTTGKRHVPAAVKRAVQRRDGGQCRS